MTKYCPRCRKSKPYSEFYTNISNSDGYGYHCKECSKEINRISYHAHKNPTVKPPNFSTHGNLSQVLPFLIKISKQKNDRNLLLNEAIETIKESIA